jgi:putative endonuclease
MNWMFEKTEIDIVAERDGMLVFAEVKTRSTDQFGFPEESVTGEKQRHLSKAAGRYADLNPQFSRLRFDIVSVTIQNDKASIYHIEDAFFPRGT